MLAATISLKKEKPGYLSIVTPEDPREHPSNGRVSILPRSAVVLMEH